MKSILLGIFACGLASFASAEASRQQAAICMEAGTDQSPDMVTLVQARWIASKLFAQIGVDLHWYWKGSAQCVHSINIRFQAAPARTDSEILAAAMPFEGSTIRIFYDHVRGAERKPSAEKLGYVMAHEIGHMLEGTVRHSREGIMKARWSRQDAGPMFTGALGFADEDVYLIHMGLDRRIATQGPMELAKVKRR
jgi:hypothetical protein